MPAESIETAHSENEYDLDKIYSCVRLTSAVQSVTAIVIILIRIQYADVIRYEMYIFLISLLSTLLTLFISIVLVLCSNVNTRELSESNSFHRICCKCFYSISIINCIGSWFIAILEKAIMQHFTNLCVLLAVTWIVYSLVCVLMINCNIQIPNIENNLLLIAYISCIVGFGGVHYGFLAFLYQPDIILNVLIITSILIFLGVFYETSSSKTSKKTLYLWFNSVTSHLVTYSYGYHVKMQFYERMHNLFDQNLIPILLTYDDLLK